MLNKDSNSTVTILLLGDYKQRAELALAVLGYTSPELVSHRRSGAAHSAR